MILKKSIQMFADKGFHRWRLSPHDRVTKFIVRRNGYDRWLRNPGELAHLAADFTATAKAGRNIRIVSFRAFESATLVKLRRIGEEWGKGSHPHYCGWPKFEDELKGVKEIDELHVVFSLKAMPQSRVMSSMPWLGQNAQGEYAASAVYERDRYQDGKIYVTRRIHFRFLGGIDSKRQLKSSLDSLADHF